MKLAIATAQKDDRTFVIQEDLFACRSCVFQFKSPLKSTNTLQITIRLYRNFSARIAISLRNYDLRFWYTLVQSIVLLETLNVFFVIKRGI